MTKIIAQACVLISFIAAACTSSQTALYDSSYAEYADIIDLPTLVNSPAGPLLHAAYKGADNKQVFVSFLVDETGQIVNPLAVQYTDEDLTQKAVRALERVRFEPGRIGLQPISVEMTMPVSFRGQNNAPDLYDFLDQVPVLLGSMESLIKEIQYPERARRAHLEGRVTVAFIVDVNGVVRLPTVTQSLGAGCDEEALRAIQLARFAPGRLDGVPVNVITSLTFVFTLI
ncbi:MAG: TonB family protein [Rhodothermaceae bacterium]|nr:TonB family protein [Rhodothermaceae bacterium]MYF63564.1 TonB family protein [Rhodothermaceae bacterium]MYI84722.1 TonB family protein [Rhodothermaceae bacterium]